MKRLGRAALMSMVLGLAAVPLSNAEAVSLTLEPASSTAYVGDQFTIDLQISGLGNGTSPSVGAFGALVQFDPILVAFVDYALGTGLGTSFDDSLGDNRAGGVELYEVSLEMPDYLNALQADVVRLATLTFRALAAGTAAFGIDASSVISDESAFALEIEQYGGATATISRRDGVIPIPSTALLLLPGMLYLCFGRKRWGRPLEV